MDSGIYAGVGIIIGGLFSGALMYIVYVRRPKFSDEQEIAMDALARIVAERSRQLSQEGHSISRDDFYTDELAIAAACYLNPARYSVVNTSRGSVKVPEHWPFAIRWWKPQGGRVRQLEKAGALVLADLERELRKEHRMRKRLERLADIKLPK